MNQKVVIIGGGINGLVAANYLQRGGFEVVLLESKPVVGGACAVDSLYVRGKRYDYPSGATVLGFMQDFVYAETGLDKRLSVYAPKHPPVVWFESLEQPCFPSDDIQELKKETKQKWNEEGDVEGFFCDLERVRAFLIRGYREAVVPTIESAAQELGEQTARLWVSGSARNLVNHYFTSEPMKVYCSLEVTESGPVSIDAPYSAFSIPLMNSGSIFGGSWGFVKGGLWKLTEQLDVLNQGLGVKVITSAKVLNISQRDMTVTYEQNAVLKQLPADYFLFATDPLSAAKIIDDRGLLEQVGQKNFLGTSGKLVLLFQNPVIWKDNSRQEDFDLAFKFVIAVDTMDALESTSQAVVSGHSDFVPGYFEIYCEGAAMRKLGVDRGYDSLTIFFKNLAFSKKGEELPNIKQAVESIVLARIKNQEDLIESILLTPKDLNQRFFFPEGNIDHIELSDGQTYFARNFSPDPAANFYQFGNHERIRYCAAGSYPCGSIAGTTGYMCAVELIRALSG